MAHHTSHLAIHVLAACILLLGAIIAYSMGFANDIGIFLIGGVIFEIGFWAVLMLTTWNRKETGSF